MRCPRNSVIQRGNGAVTVTQRLLSVVPATCPNFRVSPKGCSQWIFSPLLLTQATSHLLFDYFHGAEHHIHRRRILDTALIASLASYRALMMPGPRLGLACER